MRCWKILSASLISLSLFGAGAEAATSLCTTPAEMAALRAAALQQELMVAGLTCQSIDAYNHFVLAYRPELQKSDADLKAYLVRRNGARGEADYDTFKTKLANLSSLSTIANSSGYCASTRATFDMALRGRQSLDSFVASQRLMIALPEQHLCVADPARPIIAGVESAPVAPRRVAAVAAAPNAPAYDPPPSRFGAGPSQSRGAPPPSSYPSQQSSDSRDGDEDDYDDEDEDVAPIPPYLSQPPRPAIIEAQRGYGLPHRWAPPPYPRAYGQYPYSYYGR